MKFILLTFLNIILVLTTYAKDFKNSSNCSAILKNDTLIISNGKIVQIFKWNNGNLIRLNLSRKDCQQSLVVSANTTSSQFLTNYENSKIKGSISVQEIPENKVFKAHTLVEVVGFEGELAIKRVFKLYPNISSIACDFYLKGIVEPNKNNEVNITDLKNIESEEAKRQGAAKAPYLDSFHIKGNHWKVKSIEFFDVTDRNNTLVQEYERLLYGQESLLRGNLLFLKNQTLNQSFYILKEAPSSSTQLNYPGYDFILKSGMVKVVGFGLTNLDINDREWIKAYSVIVGIAEEYGEYHILSALKEYQQNMRNMIPERDNMIMSNTWGDRNQDKKLNQNFLLNELMFGEKLGITHFQIDDGWQTGKSANSVFGGSFDNIWRNQDYWKPDPQRFPNGFKPIIDSANKSGIRISTWFNPSADSNYKYWENDANVLIKQYRDFGINIWKIDGVNLTNKQSEINFRKFLNKVQAATNGECVFNIDVTAGRRFGYHYGYEYGNIFLENRYTDWANYYPYWTLRNLWMLSPYVPLQRIQAEFLNKWRNLNQYTNEDLLSPSHYTFEMLFAIGMFAQPLAWFELTGLPNSAFQLKKSIDIYKKHWFGIHKGKIFPIGSEPDGKSWTGFQSIISSKEGYILLIRESNNLPIKSLELFGIEAGVYKFEKVLGQGSTFETSVQNIPEVTFLINKNQSFSLYKYQKK